MFREATLSGSGRAVRHTSGPTDSPRVTRPAQKHRPSPAWVRRRRRPFSIRAPWDSVCRWVCAACRSPAHLSCAAPPSPRRKEAAPLLEPSAGAWSTPFPRASPPCIPPCIASSQAHAAASGDKTSRAPPPGTRLFCTEPPPLPASPI